MQSVLKDLIKNFPVLAVLIILTIGIQTAKGEPDFTKQVKSEPHSAERAHSDGQPSDENLQSDDLPINQARPIENEPPKPTKLIIATWSGAYKKAQELAYFQPFSKTTGQEITVQIHSGGLSRLKSTGGSDNHNWDVIDLSRLSLQEACNLGLLEELNVSDLEAAPDGTPAENDFLPSSIHKCGIGSMAWSFAIVFDRTKFKKTLPGTAKDFFDVNKFPGRRSLPKRPQYTLELALLADGAPPESIYAQLQTEEGLQRAFSVLNKIKDQIIWWSNGTEPFSQLKDESVVMATAFSGRIFTEVVTNRTPLEIIWDGQIYDTVFWSIPKSSQNKKKAVQFIKFATSSHRMARQSMLFPYGPLRKSAVSLVGKHAMANIHLDRFLPTQPENLKNALRFDSRWWRQHGKSIEEKFEIWRNGNPDATRDQNPTALDSVTD